MPTFADRGVSLSQRGGSPTAVISDFYTGAATFSFMQLLNCTHEAEFQTHYLSESLVAPGIHGPLDLLSGSLTTRPQRRSSSWMESKQMKLILSHIRVTSDGVFLWLDQPNLYIAHDYILQITTTQKLVFSVTVSISLLGNIYQPWKFLCSWPHILAGCRPSHINLLPFYRLYLQL
jgi:hypothetical protein